MEEFPRIYNSSEKIWHWYVTRYYWSIYHLYLLSATWRQIPWELKMYLILLQTHRLLTIFCNSLNSYYRVITMLDGEGISVNNEIWSLTSVRLYINRKKSKLFQIPTITIKQINRVMAWWVKTGKIMVSCYFRQDGPGKPLWKEGIWIDTWNIKWPKEEHCSQREEHVKSLRQETLWHGWRKTRHAALETVFNDVVWFRFFKNTILLS